MRVLLLGNDHEDDPAGGDEHAKPALHPDVFPEVEGTDEGGEAGGKRLADEGRAHGEGSGVKAGVTDDDPEKPRGGRQPEEAHGRQEQIAREKAAQPERDAGQRLAYEHDRADAGHAGGRGMDDARQRP